MADAAVEWTDTDDLSFGWFGGVDPLGAGELAGVSARMVQRRVPDPAFAEQVEQLSSRLTELTVRGRESERTPEDASLSPRWRCCTEQSRVVRAADRIQPRRPETGRPGHERDASRCDRLQDHLAMAQRTSASREVSFFPMVGYRELVYSVSHPLVDVAVCSAGDRPEVTRRDRADCSRSPDGSHVRVLAELDPVFGGSGAT
jgi:hypothetical protein